MHLSHVAKVKKDEIHLRVILELAYFPVKLLLKMHCYSGNNKMRCGTYTNCGIAPSAVV